MQTAKQDRVQARTPEQLVRQYNLGRVSSEMLAIFKQMNSVNISVQQLSSQTQGIISRLDGVEDGIKNVAGNLGTAETGIEKLLEQVTALSSAVEALKSVNTVQTWFGVEAPTPLNKPMADWEESEMDSHIGNIYLDTVTKRMYLFNKTDEGVYEWVECVNTLPTDITEGGGSENNG